MFCNCFFRKPVSNYKQGVCEVCRLVGGDKTIKDVSYCEFCQVNICEKCNIRYDKRLFAAIKKKFLNDN